MNRKYLKAVLIGFAVVAAFVILHYGCQESKDLTFG